MTTRRIAGALALLAVVSALVALWWSAPTQAAWWPVNDRPNRSVAQGYPSPPATPAPPNTPAVGTATPTRTATPTPPRTATPSPTTTPGATVTPATPTATRPPPTATPPNAVTAIAPPAASPTPTIGLPRTGDGSVGDGPDVGILALMVAAAIFGGALVARTQRSR